MVLSIQRHSDLKNHELPDRANQLLNLLPEPELQNLLAYSERVIIPAKKNLYKPGELIRQVYFPLQGIISLTIVNEDGLVAESAAISNEGMVSIAGFLGGNKSSNLVTAQTDCIAISLPINILRREFNRGGELHRVLLLYAQFLHYQVSQNVFCSCHHTLEQRLARWLLFYRDRLKKNQFRLTQETLADLLGVRRSSLSAVAVDLRQRNLIHYSRGKIMILDSEALKQAACECNRSISDEYKRLFDL
ncbi:MAG: Crp/Fnr family transcriptional regulator [Cyanobacteria bacterium J06631_2]